MQLFLLNPWINWVFLRFPKRSFCSERKVLQFGWLERALEWSILTLCDYCFLNRLGKYGAAIHAEWQQRRSTVNDSPPSGNNIQSPWTAKLCWDKRSFGDGTIFNGLRSGPARCLQSDHSTGLTTTATNNSWIRVQSRCQSAIRCLHAVQNVPPTG